MPVSPLNQRLSIFLTASLAAIPYLHAQSNAGAIVPHRYIVVYRDAAIPANAEATAASAGMHISQRNDRFGIATVQAVDPVPAAHSRMASNPSDDETVMQRLAAQPNVEYVLHDRIVTAHHLILRPTPLDTTFKVVTTAPAPYDTYYNSPQGWAIRQVGGYGANTPGGPSSGPWNISTGKGVRIAILDSGVDQFHPDLTPNLALNLSEINQNDLPSPCDDGTPQDQQGHGTWTASLAAAAMGPRTGQVIGVAPSATLLNIKVLERMPTSGSNATVTTGQCEAGEATGLLSWVIQGIQDAIANRADVISMSLGTLVDLSTGDGAGLKATFDHITYAATQAGVVLVAAAGNDGYDLNNPRYVELPAQARGVLALVASTNPSCSQNTAPNATCAPGPVALAYYSNYGAPLNALAAPGGSYPNGEDDLAVSGWVRGACSSGLPNTVDGLPADSQHSFGCFNQGHAAYVEAIGTSASAPLAAGVAALLRAAHPDWDATAIVSQMRSSATSASTLPVPQVNAATILSHP